MYLENSKIFLANLMAYSFILIIISLACTGMGVAMDLIPINIGTVILQILSCFISPSFFGGVIGSFITITVIERNNKIEEERLNILGQHPIAGPVHRLFNRAESNVSVYDNFEVRASRHEIHLIERFKNEIDEIVITREFSRYGFVVFKNELIVVFEGNISNRIMAEKYLNAYLNRIEKRHAENSPEFQQLNKMRNVKKVSCNN
jgi:hypothetical protein